MDYFKNEMFNFQILCFMKIVLLLISVLISCSRIAGIASYQVCQVYFSCLIAQNLALVEERPVFLGCCLMRCAVMSVRSN